jgi:exosortase
LALACVATLAGLTAGFLPTIMELIRTWNSEADYSHGFLVAPIALLLLWLRRDAFPNQREAPAWGGLVLLAAGVAIALIGKRLVLSPLAGWALILWLGGAVWLLAGRRVFWWASPGLAFLFFAVPLPYRVEQIVSSQLQRISTIIGNWVLQFCGQPAVAVGHTIHLNGYAFDVENACSGLRMFVGTAALAFAFCVAIRRTWWHKGLLLLAFPVVAIAANALRVATTALLFQYTSSEAAHRFAHDFAGWAMIGVATVLFGLVALYLRYLIIEEVPSMPAESARS